MWCALLSKNKLKLVYGSIINPVNGSRLFDAWKRCNVMVLSWITRTLSPQITKSIVYIDDVKILWKDLKERLSKGDNKSLDLLQEIHYIREGERNITQF